MAFEVWPDNWSYVMLFNSMTTQWRVGMNGPTGLDYPSLESALRLDGWPKRKWPEAFDAIRLMEEEALLEMHGN